MKIHLTLSGPLREYYRSGIAAKRETVALPGGASVGDVMTHYRILPEKVHFIVVNRRRASPATPLEEGDHLWLIPLSAGG